jgi:hypothetical protein
LAIGAAGAYGAAKNTPFFDKSGNVISGREGAKQYVKNFAKGMVGIGLRKKKIKEDAKDLEGKAERVAKTKKHKKKLVAEVSNSTLASYVSKAIDHRKKLTGMQDQARRIHTPERAQYFVDKAQKKLNSRSKGIKTAVGKIAGNLPGEKVTEGTRSEYDANASLAGNVKPTKPGHYLMRDGRKVSGPHSSGEIVGKYKDLADSKGVKIVHVKEDTKVKKAAQKAISLAKKAKGNKHVDTEPSLDLKDKGTGGPMEGSHEGERNEKLS